MSLVDLLRLAEREEHKEVIALAKKLISAGTAAPEVLEARVAAHLQLDQVSDLRLPPAPPAPPHPLHV